MPQPAGGGPGVGMPFAQARAPRPPQQALHPPPHAAAADRAPPPPPQQQKSQVHYSQPAEPAAPAAPGSKPPPKPLPSDLRPAMKPTAVRVQRQIVARPRPVAAAHVLAPTISSAPPVSVTASTAAAAAPAAAVQDSYDDFMASMKGLGAF